MDEYRRHRLQFGILQNRRSHINRRGKLLFRLLVTVMVFWEHARHRWHFIVRPLVLGLHGPELAKLSCGANYGFSRYD